MMQTKMGKVFSVALTVTVVAWGMAFVFGAMAGESVNSAMKKLETKTSAGKSVHEKVPMDLSGIEEVRVEVSSQDVDLLAGDDQAATAEFDGTGTKDGSRRLQVEKQGSSLQISLKKVNDMGFHFSWGNDNSSVMSDRIRVKLPKSYRKDLRVVAHSGDIQADGLNLSTLDITTSSGEITAKNCTAERSRLHSSSGDMTLEMLSGGLEAEASSGEITVRAFNGSDLRVRTSSGDIEVTEPKTDAINVGATSGDVKVKLGSSAKAGEMNWHVQLHATSGTIQNEIGDNPSGKRRLDVHTTSGDISIER